MNVEQAREALAAIEGAKQRESYGNGRTAVQSTRAQAQAAAVRAKTDLGNAERLVDAHGPELRHVAGIGWLAWDGRRWAPDADGAVVRAAKETVRAIYDEAARLEDDDARRALAAHAVKSESRARLEAMVALAESEERVIAVATDLDAHPLLLNVENGTVDLATGDLRERRPKDMLTRFAPVAYEPDARDEAWERFLERTTGGDQELAGFLRRAAGYTLTGDTGEEVLFFAHGPEATGKSTLLEAKKAMLGDYAATADFETFIARRGDAGPRADIARLAGARLVTSLEVEEGKRLAEGLIKQLTGGDTVAARFLYGATFEYRPAFKLWLAANARPQVSANDGAIWRRIVQVPFVEQVPAHERDPNLKAHLKTDPGARSAILAWAVRGCLEWQRDGLAVPARVREYTADYRRENDLAAEWIEACCLLEASATTSARELRTSYEVWSEGNGEKPVSPKAWGDALRARGCERARHRSGRVWRGIELAGGVTGDRR